MGRALILLCCAFLTACSSVQPQYYTLGTPEISSVEHQHKPVKSIGVARIRLPSLLDRQGMVLRKDNFSVEVSEQAQWAGILRDEVNESLIAGLQAPSSARARQASPLWRARSLRAATRRWPQASRAASPAPARRAA